MYLFVFFVIHVSNFRKIIESANFQTCACLMLVYSIYFIFETFYSSGSYQSAGFSSIRFILYILLIVKSSFAKLLNLANPPCLILYGILLAHRMIIY